jgi:hypothetical protein
MLLPGRNRIPRSRQRSAWRGNRRLLQGAWDGLQVGDVVVLPKIPRPGVWAIARITGPYRYEIDPVHYDYGHIRDVEPRIRGCIAVFGAA